MLATTWHGAVGLVGLVLVGANGSFLRAHQWSPAMGEARALERAAKDLHKAIDRTHDEYAARVSERLRESVCSFVERLNRAACTQEVLESQCEVAIGFEQISATVDVNPLLRHDSRVSSAMERMASHFNRLDEKIRPVIWSARNKQQLPLSPWDDPRFRQPAWLGVPLPSPGAWHPGNLPGYVSPGDWHYSNVPGAIPAGSWHQSNVPGYVSPGSWHYTNTPGATLPGSWHQSGILGGQ